MRRRSSRWGLLVCLLILSAGLPSLASTVAWFCDGRLCGTVQCCCEQPQARATDPNCARRGPDASSLPSLCASGCACTALVSATPDSATALQPAAPTPTPEIVASPPAPPMRLRPAALTLRPARRPDYRGPPTATPALPAAGLRAPPAS